MTRAEALTAFAGGLVGGLLVAGAWFGLGWLYGGRNERARKRRDRADRRSIESRQP